jgi:hypothetical protein
MWRMLLAVFFLKWQWVVVIMWIPLVEEAVLFFLLVFIELSFIKPLHVTVLVDRR